MKSEFRSNREKQRRFRLKKEEREYERLVKIFENGDFALTCFQLDVQQRRAVPVTKMTTTRRVLVE
jgi:hypothetical protein